MLVQSNQLPKFFHLQQFAFNHLLRQFNQRVENAEVPLLHRYFESLHVEPVACEHALRVAPLGIGGGPAATCFCFVDYVVVHQRGSVDDLDHRAQSHSPASFVAKELGRKKEKRWTYPLASAGPQILSDLRDGLHARDGILPELVLQRREVIVQQVEDFLPVNESRCAQCRFLLLVFTTETRSHGGNQT